MSRPLCSTDGCEKPVWARGLCQTHYRSWWRKGLARKQNPRPPRPRKIITRRLVDYPPPTPQETPCRLWQGIVDHDGYGRTPRTERMHVWVWEQINGPVPSGMQINHRCDNPPCYRYDHLWLGTQLENIADRHAKGRDHRGPRERSH